MALPCCFLLFCQNDLIALYCSHVAFIIWGQCVMLPFVCWLFPFLPPLLPYAASRLSLTSAPALGLHLFPRTFDLHLFSLVLWLY